MNMCSGDRWVLVIALTLAAALSLPAQEKISQLGIILKILLSSQLSLFIKGVTNINYFHIFNTFQCVTVGGITWDKTELQISVVMMLEEQIFQQVCFTNLW